MPQCPGEDASDSLFLLEVLVKEVNYAYDKINLDKQFLSSLEETCVLVKFLHYPPMEIRQEGCDYNSPRIVMGSGKSCLFSMNRNSFSQTQKLNAVLNVVRMCPAGSKTKCITMGKGCIDLTKNFLQLFRQSCSSASPVTKCVNEVVTLLNDECMDIGCVSVFLRLSCFGNQITTQFKMGSGDRSSFVFKGEDPNDNLNVPSECFKVCKGDDDKEAAYGERRSQGGYASQGRDAWGQFPSMGPMQSPQVPFNDWGGQGNFAGPQAFGPTGFGAGGFGGPQFGGSPDCGVQAFGGPPVATNFPQPTFDQPGYGGGRDDVYQYGKPWNERDDLAGFKGGQKESVQGACPNCTQRRDTAPQIEASERRLSQKSSTKKKNGKDSKSNGTSFPKDFPFCQRVTIGDGDTESEETPIPEGPKLNLCDCDFPTPPGLLNPCPPPPKPKKKKKPSCPLDVQPGDYCMRPDCPCGLPIVPWMKGIDEEEKSPKKKPENGNFTMAPGSVGVKGKQIIFQMNDKDIPLTEADKKFMASTQYKVGAIGDKTGPKNVIQMMPEKLPPDPLADKDHDIFILKIGKKNDANKKAKMEIELKTPKLEDNTPKKMDNETQWLDSDLPAPPAGKKGGKDKGGKGGKGKKKK